jgi:glyoxylase-like metal-dependent hydrolase (beta-lactamase superfamily II)
MPFENYRGEQILLVPGQSVKLDEDRLEILFLPGHSPGSVGFYSREGGFLIGGDVLFRESIGRTDLPGGDHATLLQSIREQLWPLPDETIVYPGHGEPTTIGHERAHNPFLR